MNRIRLLRLENNMSAIDLSDRLGVTIKTLYGIESSKATIRSDILLKISALFNVSIDYILGKSDVRTLDILEKNQRTFLINNLKEINI